MNDTELKIATVRNRLQETLNELGREFGFVGSIGTITYSTLGMHMPVTIKNKVVDGKPGAQVEYEVFAGKFGYNPLSFGRTFSYNGDEYVITGVASKAKKFPILATKKSDGRTIKCGVEFTREAT
jgi:hypothetical protein